MGGRGSAYSNILDSLKDKLMDLQLHKNPKINLSKDYFTWDEESIVKDSVFKSLKKANVSERNSINTMVTNRNNFNKVQKQLDILSNKYKKILSELETELHFGVDREKDVARAQYYGVTAKRFEDGQMKYRLGLAPREINGELLEQQYSEVLLNYKAPIWKVYTPLYTITHEFGHVIERGIENKLYKQNKIPFGKKATKYIKEEVIKIYNKKYTKPQNNDKIYLSRYSMDEDGEEWFAETFTHLMLAKSQIQPIALALSDYIDSFN